MGGGATAAAARSTSLLFHISIVEALLPAPSSLRGGGGGGGGGAPAPGPGPAAPAAPNTLPRMPAGGGGGGGGARLDDAGGGGAGRASEDWGVVAAWP